MRLRKWKTPKERDVDHTPPIPYLRPPVVRIPRRHSRERQPCFRRENPVLGIDFPVWLALMLSLASAILCVAYGVTRWNLDDDSERETGDAATVQTTREMGKRREDM